MMVSTKPILSPSRTEKYPPPLMRFLRSNVGSRSSKGRSRASPMFVVRKKNSSAIETQEPSSPKVTCMGQVRVRRSSKRPDPKPDPHGGAPSKRRRWWCVRKSLLCRHFFSQKLIPRSICGFRPVLRKWVLFLRFGYCKKVEIRDDSPKKETNRRVEYRETDEEDEEVDLNLKVKEGDLISSSPPKNALLLTRCRSAPYRSSSLANRFWVSPSSKSETEDNDNEGHKKEEEEEIRQSECGDSKRIDRQSEENLGVSEEFEDSIDGKIKEDNILGNSGRPLILTRCKSEPAKTGERLNPDASFWRRTRLGFANNPHSPHVCD